MSMLAWRWRTTRISGTVGLIYAIYDYTIVRESMFKGKNIELSSI